VPTPTWCRICESGCGLLAEVAHGEVTRLVPDPDHPVSRGYACVKGTRFHRIAHGTDRLRTPRIDGKKASWDEALALARGARDALYTGNAIANDAAAILGVERFVRATGARHYSCLTLDNAPQLAVCQLVFGTPIVPFLADFERSDLVILAGTDPLASAASQQQGNPLAGAVLREAGRAGRLFVIDPRGSATAAQGEHLAVRPGTDVAWLHALVAERGHLAGIPAPDWDAVAAITGVPRERWEVLRTRLAAAERPLVWSGLGVLLGPDGTLGWWLTLLLQAALGGLGRPGGWIRPPAPIDLAQVGRMLGLSGLDPALRSSTGHASVVGTRNAASLVPDVAAGRVRSLVVLGGEPWRSLPGDRSPLADLELVVSIDIRARALPGRRVVELPATSWLERADLGFSTSGGTPGGYVRAAEAVIPPVGAARDAWWILGQLANHRIPLPSPLPWLRAMLRPVARSERHGYRPRRTADHPVPTPVLEPPALRAALAAWRPPAPGPALVTSVRPIGRMTHWIDGSPRAIRVHPSRVPTSGRVALSAGGVRREVPVTGDPSLAVDAVVWPFGGDPDPNGLLAGAPLEPFTGQPRSNGLAVQLDPVEGAR
jgi:formate dehydrogenase